MPTDSQTDAPLREELKAFGYAINNLVTSALGRGLSMPMIAAILDQASFKIKFVDTYRDVTDKLGETNGVERSEGSTGEEGSKIITSGFGG